MADWSNPTLVSTYTSVLDTLKARDSDAALMFDPALVTPTNLPTGSIRWTSAGNKFEKFNGTAWVDLATTYAINADQLDGQHGAYYLAWANFTGVPATFAPSAHTHDDRYYTETEADARYGNNLFVSGDTIQLRTVGNTALTTITVPYATNAGTVGNFSVGQNLNTNSNVSFGTIGGTTITASSSVATPAVSSAGALAISAAGANALTLLTNGAERLRIDSAGNVGLGATPPANTTYPGLFLAQSGMFDYQGNGGLFYNAYTTGVGQLKYRAGSLQVAAYIFDQNGTHTWSNAPAGLANGAVTLVERMKLTSAGNFSVGTLDANDFGASYRTIQVTGSTGGVFRASNTAATAVGDFYVDAGAVSIRTATNVPLAFLTNSAERMRLDSDGDLGIGTATPGFILDVQGSTANKSRINVLRTGSSGVGAQLLSTGALAGVAATAAGPLALYTSDVVRLLIDAAGNVGIGTATPADLLHLSSSAPNFRLTDTDTGSYTQLSAANSTGSFGIYVDQGNTVASSIFLLYIDGAEKVRVDATGNLTATGNVTAYSDERLKSDIRTIPQALDLVQEMRGVFFEKDGTTGVGVIAQEMELVLPEVVLNGEFKSVAYGNIVGVLIEAIKELRAEVGSLKGA